MSQNWVEVLRCHKASASTRKTHKAEVEKFPINFSCYRTYFHCAVLTVRVHFRQKVDMKFARSTDRSLSTKISFLSQQNSHSVCVCVCVFVGGCSRVLSSLVRWGIVKLVRSSAQPNVSPIPYSACLIKQHYIAKKSCPVDITSTLIYPIHTAAVPVLCGRLHNATRPF